MPILAITFALTSWAAAGPRLGWNEPSAKAASCRKGSICLMAPPPPPPPPPGGNGFEVFVGTLLQAAEETAKVASDAADQWVNNGWQVKKRAGQVLPEIRPNTQNVEAKATQWLEPSNSGQLVS